MPNRCQAASKNGNPCRSFAQTDSIYCFAHDPKSADKRQRARLIGGFNHRALSHRPFPDCDLTHPTGLLNFVGHLIKDAWQLGGSVSRVRTLAQLTQIQNDILLHWRFPDEEDDHKLPFPVLRSDKDSKPIPRDAREMILKYYEALGKDPPQ